MGIFSWLFGASRSEPNHSRFDWETSEIGNPTMLHDGVRFRVFPQDGGWKFVMEDADNAKHEPFVSGRYGTQDAAKAAAIDVILDDR